LPDSKTTIRLVTLEEHQAFLKDVLATAKKRVVIVSPFISSKAINADNLSTLIKQAVARRVQVKIFVDYKLNTINGEMKLSAKEGIADMVKAGARVFIADGIHNKTLICNNDLIAEGSFNWLSAVRVKNGENQREERTFAYTGSDASKMIEQELTSIESVAYGEAGIKAKDEHSESNARLGRLAILGAILVAPIIGGSDVIQKVGGFIITGLVLGGYFGLIWLRNRLVPESAEESHQTVAGFDDDDTPIGMDYNHTAGNICIAPNAYGNQPGDIVGAFRSPD
jgi:PLD-like domain